MKSEMQCFAEYTQSAFEFSEIKLIDGSNRNERRFIQESSSHHIKIQ